MASFWKPVRAGKRYCYETDAVALHGHIVKIILVPPQMYTPMLSLGYYYTYVISIFAPYMSQLVCSKLSKKHKCKVSVFTTFGMVYVKIFAQAIIILLAAPTLPMLPTIKRNQPDNSKTLPGKKRLPNSWPGAVDGQVAR